MSTLILRLAAPLQSWGIDSKYNKRSTNREPSKSGIIGLLGAALGLSRNNPPEDLWNNLCKLRFGIRVEQEGNLLVDYQNANGPFKKIEGKDNYQYTLSDNSISIKINCLDSQITTTQTWRYYLSDAVFLVGLEGDRNMIEKLEYALTHPIFPLFLGRRSCPPMPPLVLGIRDCDLPTALRDEPWQALDWFKKKHKNDRDLFLRVQYEPAEGEPYQAVQRDLPISFDQSHRRYGYRGYTTMPPIHINPDQDQPDKDEEELFLVELENHSEHDPMKELEE